MSGDNGMTEEKLRHYLKRTVAELDSVGARLREVEQRAREPIAIVGMACRFPRDIDSPEAFWEFISEGGDAVAEVPLDRGWEPTPDARLGGMLTAAGDFDAGFFGISPREALAMDPQQRIMLEISWEALERAGHDPDSLRGSATGVFTGVGAADYGPRPDEAPDEVLGYVGTGTATSVVSGRVAYCLGLEGPAVTVDTACSSGLTAVHLAAEALRRDECELALAGGVTVMSSPGAFTEFRSQGGLAADGRCKPFSRSADGFGLAEGAGVLVLQRLSAALRDGRPVLAVLRGSAVNSDGASNGLTAPSGPSQQRVIRRALANAGVRAEDIDYVEAHGTGTRLGDPIEAHALLETYGAVRDSAQPLWIGSVKSNLGHTQAAAGVAGVMKTVLALRHSQLPPTLHFDEPSPHIDWDLGGVAVVARTRPWPAGARMRRAGVSAFGISGTNAHVILEEAPTASAPEPAADSGPVPLVFSGRDEQALRAYADRLADRLDREPRNTMRDIGSTLATRRATWEHRAVVVGDRDDARTGLRAMAAGRSADRVTVGRARPRGGVVMVFPGQGAQWRGMARDLLRESSVFAQSIRDCERALAPHVDWSLTDLLTGAEPLDRVDIVQPTLFSVMVSLAALWRSYGVTPAALVGHSQGEIAAAHIAGALSLADAAKLVAVRSRILRRLGGQGGMVSVGLDADRVTARIERFAGTLSLASVNGPRSVVVAGTNESLDELVAECEAESVTARRIPVDYASHSPQVAALRDELLSELADIAPVSASIPLYSTTTGQLIDTAAMDADYWYTNLRERVRFHDAIGQLADAGFDVFLEVSPHPVLTVGIEATLESRQADACVAGTLRRDRGGLADFHVAAGEAYVRGVPVDWSPAFGDARPVDLPVYPFQRQRFWLPVPTGGRVREADNWRYRVVWRKAEWADAAPTGSVLLVTGPGVPADWSAAVRDGLAERGASITVCEADSRANLAAAVASVDTAGVSTVVSLLALAENAESADPSLNTLALVRALGAAGVDAPLWVLTRGGVQVAADDQVDPAQAMLTGTGRVIGIEYPGRWGGVVDMTAPDAASIRSLTAVLANPRDEDQIAIRSDGIAVARLVPAPAHPARTRWTPRGTVLVTGGTGGIGANVARWLANSGAEHLVLLGRSGADAPGAAALRDELTALGVGVTIAACNVADRAQLEAVLAVERAEGRTIRAVLHAAGVSRSTPIEQLTDAEFAEIVAAKVDGTRNLDALCPDLEALVLFSSNAGVWGSPGLAAYAAANAFLDGFARRRRGEGAPVVSIAWGLWAGQTMAGEQGGAYLRDQGLRAMDPRRAIEELRIALDHDDTCVSVIDWDRPRFVELFTAARHRPLLDELTPERVETPQRGRGPELAQRLADLSISERRLHLSRIIHVEVAAVLGHAEDVAIDHTRPFRDLGFDSMTAVDLRNRLTTATGVREAATVVFDHPTVQRLTEHYLEQLVGSPVAEPVSTASGETDGGIDEPIAIVGMACRFPGGVRNPDQLWDFIVADGDAVTEMPSDRGWDLDALFDSDPERRGTSYSRHGAFLDGAADFDAAFFGISPREALAMDPQQRQVLETMWELFENAGVAPDSLRGSDTGIFLGAAYQGYGRGAEIPESSEGYLLTGGSSAVVSGRVAYVLGLTGPAITVDTACSSSLVAMHMAGNALRAGDCGLAVAGGVSVMAGPEVFIEFSRQGALAADGRCKPFSDDADGFGFAEGVAVVLLQRLSDARRAGRRVLGVVAGSAINQDGASNGLSAPNGVAQQQVIRRVWERAGISGADVAVVEAHGTGTRLGDPIEASAVLATYGTARGSAAPLVLGSVKANIGHAQAAAGVAGVIKMVLGLNRGLIPPMLCRGERSSFIEWDMGTVELADAVRPWPAAADGVRRAGVSAFGVSGTNAHVIIAEPPRSPSASPSETIGLLNAVEPLPVLLSAKTEAALATLARRLEAAVDDSVPVAELAASVATGRTHLPHRAALSAGDHERLRCGLRAVAEGLTMPGVHTGTATTDPRVVFVFPGQGAQWPGMARDLLTIPVVADTIATCDTVLNELAGFTVSDVLRQRDNAPELERVDVVQPVLFAVMVALARLWKACGVAPAAVIGHSQGEIAAAVVAGALTLDEGLTIVTRRAQAIHTLVGAGGMVAVAASRDQIDELIADAADRISVAAINSPTSVVVSGDPQALADLVTRCERAGVRAKTLPVDYASHSPHIDRIRETVRTDLDGINPRRATVPLYSTLYGERRDDVRLDARYWYANLRSPVRFSEAVTAAVADGHRVFVEMSPHPLLLAAMQETAEDVVAFGSLHRDTGGVHLLGELARAHVHGVPVDWRAIVGARPALPLPNYPFELQRYWLAPASSDRLSDLRYRVDWIPLATRPTTLAGSCLVFGAAPHALTRAIEEVGARVVPIASIDRDALTAALREVAAEPTAVLSVFTDVAAHLAVHQLLGAADVHAPLWLLTSRGADLDEVEPVDPDQAMVWGLGRVMGLETPERWGGLIDAPDDSTPADWDAVVAGLGADDDEDQIVVRDGIRYGRRLVHASLTHRESRWEPMGTALITGGTGALGGHVARFLARSGIEDLVLVSRSGPAAPGAADLEAELVALGAKTTIVSCDVTDRAQLGGLLDELRGHGRSVRTVVHTAGVPESRPLSEIDRDELNSVCAPKVSGARLLDELCVDADTFVLFSSGAGVWGSALLGAYSAANAYLDALARRRRSQGRAATAIAWGAWAGEGMAAGDRDGLARRGLAPMAPQHALRALRQALDNDDTCVSIADIDWERFAVGFTAARPRPLIDELVAAPTAPATRVEPVRTMTGGRVLDLTHAQVAAALGHTDRDAVGLDQPFTELGFDSLSAVGLRNQLQQATGLSLPATLVFEHPTVRRLADHLRGQLDSETTAPARSSDSTLRSGYRQAELSGRVRPYIDLLADLSDFREHFDDAAGPNRPLELLTLAEGSGPVTVICCAGTSATSGPHEFARLADALRGTAPVHALRQLGYEDGEPLPSSLEAALRVQADAIIAAQDGKPFVLAGHSAGALMAYALATELADRGRPPHGVVLIDVYPPGHQQAVHAWLNELTAALFDRESVPMDDTRLTAMGAYDRFTGRWQPRDTGLPTLLVRATEPMGPWPDESWAATWPFGHDAVEVPGDHFTMIQEHADAIAAHIAAWLTERNA